MTLTSDLKYIIFTGFLDPKNVRKVVSFIILAFFIFFQYLRTAAILNFGCKKKASSYFFRVFRFFGSWGLTLSYNKNSACYIFFLGLTLMLLCYIYWIMGIENTYDFRVFLGIKSVLCYKDLNCKIEVDKGTTTNVINTDITITNV